MKLDLRVVFAAAAAALLLLVSLVGAAEKEK